MIELASFHLQLNIWLKESVAGAVKAMDGAYLIKLAYSFLRAVQIASDQHVRRTKLDHTTTEVQFIKTQLFVLGSVTNLYSIVFP